MSDSKRQSIITIGIAMILISGIILYYSLSIPRDSALNVSESTLIETQSSVNVSESVSSEDITQITQENSQSATSSSSTSQNTNSNSAVTANASATTAATTTKSTASSTTSVTFPINLNTCTATDLQAISGIGEKKAQLIIEYREYLGGYTSTEQLKNIKGIGDSTYEKIAPYVTV